MLIGTFFRSSHSGTSSSSCASPSLGALVVHVSSVLVEKTVASHHALAQYELEKVVAYQAHAR